MDHVSKNLPTTNGSRPQGTLPLSKSSPTSTPNLKREKAVLLKELLEQSFDVFHVYSRPPEAIPNMVKAMLMVTEDATPEEISQAFRRWMRERSILPTPSDIRTNIEEDRASRISDIPPGTFTQIIRRYEPKFTGELLEERIHGKHLNPTEIWARYPGIRTHVSYRQD